MTHPLLRALVLSACLAPLGACTDAADPPTALTSDEVTTVTGTIAGNGWLTHPLTVTATSDLAVTLDWTVASANLNAFLRDASGASIEYANGTTARPERLAHAALPAGSYEIGIKNKSAGATAYTLSIATTPVFAPAYPAEPWPGTVYWGAAVSGNGDPVARHEVPAGAPLAIHRTYFQWSQRTGALVTMASDDLAHHRLPWVSIKPPAAPSWAAMGAGAYDAQIDQLLTALAALPGPVWLTVHHEPEGGGGVNAPDDPGGPAAHVAMNRRVRQRMTALGVHNVALAPILMSYTFTAASGRDPEQWWAPGIYDFFGVDHYSQSGTALTNATWATVRAWAAGKGVEVAVGEWGIHSPGAQGGELVRAWYEAAIASQRDGGGARVVGLAAFDSNLNSPDGGWELQGAQLAAFQALLADPRTASIDD